MYFFTLSGETGVWHGSVDCTRIDGPDMSISWILGKKSI